MRRSLAIVALSLLAACPSCAPEPRPSAGPVADAYVAIATAMDDRMFACAARPWWEDGDPALAAAAAALQASVDEGRLLVDQGALDACAAEVAAYSCAETFRNGDEPGCLAPPFTANVAPGGPCADDLECAGGFCGFALGTCPGACVAYAAEGEGCASLPCGPGLECPSDLCVAETTVAIGDPCDFLNVCAPPARCRLDPVAADYLCTAPGLAGDACDWNWDCAAPLVCLGGACASLVGTGEPCDALAACNPNFEYCDPDAGLCTVLPSRSEPCVEAGACAGTAWCDPTDGTCKAFPLLGEPCAIVGECIGWAFCDTSLATPLCAAPPGAGADCSVSAESGTIPACAAGLFCQRDASYVFTTCAPRVAAGVACAGFANDECVDGYYCDHAYPDPGTCVAQKEAGAACAHLDACQDDLECLGICTVTSCWP